MGKEKKEGDGHHEKKGVERERNLGKEKPRKRATQAVRLRKRERQTYFEDKGWRGKSGRRLERETERPPLTSDGEIETKTCRHTEKRG